MPYNSEALHHMQKRIMPSDILSLWTSYLILHFLPKSSRFNLLFLFIAVYEFVGGSFSFDVQDKEGALFRTKSFVYDSNNIRAADKDVKCIAHIPNPITSCGQHKQAINVVPSGEFDLIEDVSTLKEDLSFAREGYLQ